MEAKNATQDKTSFNNFYFEGHVNHECSPFYGLYGCEACSCQTCCMPVAQWVHALISRFRENALAAKKFSRSIELAGGLIGTKLSGLVDAGFAMEFASMTCSGALVVLVCPW